MIGSALVRGRPRVGPLLAVPALGLLAVFVVWPLIRSFVLSTYQSDLFGNATRFVGARNYLDAMTDPTFLRAVLVSVMLAGLSMAVAVGLALVVALLLRDRIPGGRLFQTVLSLPFAYSAASASAVFAGLFSPSIGLLNWLLAQVGLPGPDWINDQWGAIAAVVIATSWYEFGFAFLVLTAAVRDVPGDVVEAAGLDGAGGLRMAIDIVVPMIRPSILFLVVTQTITGLQTFTQIQVLTKGGPGDSTSTLVYRLYQSAFGNGTPDFGRASVFAIVLVLLVAVITAVQFRILGDRRRA